MSGLPPKFAHSIRVMGAKKNATPMTARTIPTRRIRLIYEIGRLAEYNLSLKLQGSVTLAGVSARVLHVG
jgi:hypothetical protein